MPREGAELGERRVAGLGELTAGLGTREAAWKSGIRLAEPSAARYRTPVPRSRPRLVCLLTILVVTVPLACHRADDHPRTSAPPSPAPSPRFTALDAAVVRDARTGLEWTRRDHAEPLHWTAADQHCRALVAGERRGWRLPEVQELEALYDPGIATPCGGRSPCHLDPAIRLASPYVWSGTARGEGARFYFDFAYGNAFSPGIGPTLVRQVLCVRGGS
jgi:hypothetical protein